MTFPLSRILAHAKGVSDHNPLLLNTGEGGSFGKKKFRFEKWWLEREEFKEVMAKTWSSVFDSTDPVEV
jgi:hypothetical protein